MRTAREVETILTTTWPDRAYFIEVCSTDDESDWVQVYDPKNIRKDTSR